MERGEVYNLLQEIEGIRREMEKFNFKAARDKLIELKQYVYSRAEHPEDETQKERPQTSHKPTNTKE